jgi:hypothetical protein
MIRHCVSSPMMKTIKYLLSRSFLLAACLVALVAPQSALAQGEGGAGIMAAQEATEPNWVFPYFLVVLSTGLGIYLLGKPSQRKNMDEKEGGPA